MPRSASTLEPLKALYRARPRATRKTKARPAKAVDENLSLGIEDVSPWELESTAELRERATSLGGEVAAFYEGPKTDIFIQTARRMPYFDQVNGKPVQLLWPVNGCGVFEMEGGTKGLACIRMIAFDKRTQKGKLLVEWIYTPQEASRRVIAEKPPGYTKLKKILTKMNKSEDLLLSNELGVVPTGSLLGPAIEREGESRSIKYHFNVVQWSISVIEAKPVRDLVRPVAWDPEEKMIGEMMEEAEFVERYGEYAAPKGLLLDDLHPVVENPCCVLEDFGYEEKVEEERRQREEIKEKRDAKLEERKALEEEKKKYLAKMEALYDDESEEEEEEADEQVDEGDDNLESEDD